MEAVRSRHTVTASVLHETRAPASEATAAERGITHARASWCVHTVTTSVELTGSDLLPACCQHAATASVGLIER